MERRSDFLLDIATFAASQEASSVRIGITLLVHGALVSGYAISAEEYYERAADEFAKALGMDEGSTAADEIRSSFFTLLEKAPRTSNNQPEWGAFIYLRDAAIVVPGGSVLRIPTWRGQVSSVDGWNFGQPEFPTLPGKEEEEVGESKPD